MSAARDDRHLPKLNGADVRALLGRDWPLIPCRSYVNDAGKVQKVPLVKWRHLQGVAASTEFDGWEATLWAFPTGAATCVILDADTAEAAAAAYLEPHVTTGRGVGGHLWVNPPGWPVSNGAGVLPGLDVRGDGGLAYFAGASIKGPYVARTDWLPYDIDQLPEGVARAAGLLEPPAPKERPDVEPGSWDGDGFGTEAALLFLAQRCDLIQSAPEGEWNGTLNSSTFLVARLVAGGWLDADFARDAVFEAMDDPDDLAAIATFDSGWRAGSAEPWALIEDLEPITILPEVDVPAASFDALGWLDQLTPEQDAMIDADIRQGVLEALTIGVEDVLGRRPPNWLVKGFLQERATAQLVGPFSGGKSLLTLHWCAQLVRRGHHVLYCAAEGMNGFNGRLRALMAEHGGKVPDLAGLRFYERPVNLADKDEAAALAANVTLTGPWDVVVIDTLARAIAGGDENAAGEMSKAIERAEALKGDKGAVLLVHHAGWTGKRGRGSTAIPGANDNIVHCFPASDDLDGKDGRDLVLKVEAEKVKDGRKSAPVYFRLQEHTLGDLDDGSPWTSVALVETEEPGGGGDGDGDVIVEQFIQQAGGQVTVKQMSELTGWSDTTTERRLKAAAGVGVVGKDGRAVLYGPV